MTLIEIEEALDVAAFAGFLGGVAVGLALAWLFSLWPIGQARPGASEHDSTW